MFYKYDKKTKEFTGVATSKKFIRDNEDFTFIKIPDTVPTNSKLVFNTDTGKWDIIKPKKFTVWYKSSGNKVEVNETTYNKIKHLVTMVQPFETNKSIYFDENKNEWVIDKNKLKNEKLNKLRDKKYKAYSGLTNVKDFFVKYTPTVQEQYQSLLILDEPVKAYVFNSKGNKMLKLLTPEDLKAIIKAIIKRRYEIEMEYLKEKEEILNG